MMGRNNRELFEANFGRVESRIRELEARMREFQAKVDAKLEGLKSELLRWMFLFWVGTMGTVVALLKL